MPDIPHFTFPQSPNKEGYYLVFDTETTGIAIDRNLPSTQVDNWPRLVSIAWMLFDREERLIEEAYHIVKQDAPIPDDSIKWYGITDEIAEIEGKALEAVILAFAAVAEKAQYIVAHNVAFDASVVEAEAIRAKLLFMIPNVKSVCTTMSYIGLGLEKRPSLETLYSTLFGETITRGVHNSYTDTAITAKCLFELRRRGLY